MRYIVMDNVKAMGVKADTGEQVSATFAQGSEIEGEVATQANPQGLTLLTDGAYWQFPTEKLMPKDVPQQTTELQPGTKYPDERVAIHKDPLWKHPQTPYYIGAALGGIVFMKIGEKLPVLPGVLNWLAWTAVGTYLGYQGSKKLMTKMNIKL